MFDKHLSKFMNAQIITAAFEYINDKVYKHNLSTLDIIRIIVSTLLTATIVYHLLIYF